MNKLQYAFNLLFTKKFIAKFIAYFLLVCFFYVFKDFLWIFLLTFVFAYLFLVAAEFLKAKFDLLLEKHCHRPKVWDFLKWAVWLNFIIVLEYVIFIWLIVFIVSDMIPKLINELTELPQSMPFLSDPISSITNKLVEIKDFNNELWWWLNQIVSNQDVEVILDILHKLKSASVVFMQIIISLILSFVFLIDRERLQNYLLWIKASSFKFLYKEYNIIIEKILKSFWLIIKAQAIIAFFNTILTIVWLLIIWLVHWWAFPYILTLWLIVFIAWFIPVLWVFISSIPIAVVAYSMIWWYGVIIEVVLLITIVHFFEAYFLNPRIVSKFLEVPVSLTFIILIVSEHLFWIAWLLIWVSLFYFLIWLLRDIDDVFKKKKKHIKKMKTISGTVWDDIKKLKKKSVEKLPKNK